MPLFDEPGSCDEAFAGPSGHAIIAGCAPCPPARNCSGARDPLFLGCPAGPRGRGRSLLTRVRRAESMGRGGVQHRVAACARAGLRILRRASFHPDSPACSRQVAPRRLHPRTRARFAIRRQRHSGTRGRLHGRHRCFLLSGRVEDERYVWFALVLPRPPLRMSAALRTAMTRTFRVISPFGESVARWVSRIGWSRFRRSFPPRESDCGARRRGSQRCSPRRPSKRSPCRRVTRPGRWDP